MFPLRKITLSLLSVVYLIYYSNVLINLIADNWEIVTSV